MSTEETARVSEATRAEFREKIVWITGASSGIGEGLAKSFASIGGSSCLIWTQFDRVKSSQGREHKRRGGRERFIGTSPGCC